MWKSNFLLILALAAGLVGLTALAGCETMGSLTAPRLSKQKQQDMARDSAVEYEKEHKLVEDPLLQAYFRGIIQRVDGSIPEEKKFPWSVRIVNEPEVNAFTFGGGFIYIYAGLVARMENEAQFTTVLAHEMAHCTEEHIKRGIQAQHGVFAGAKVLMPSISTVVRAKVPSNLTDLTADAFALGVQAAYSGQGRKHEREADKVGLAYMVDAGYDPREAPRTFAKLHELFGDPPPLETFFYGSHPSNVERSKYLTELYTSKYASEIEGKPLISNTEEYKRRTRRIVIAVGKLDFKLKRFNTCKAMMEKALRADDKDPVPHFYIGRVALDQGDHKGAIDHLEKAIEMKRDYAEAYRELGTAHYMAGEPKQAIAAYERYLKLAPDAPDRVKIEEAIRELRRY